MPACLPVKLAQFAQQRRSESVPPVMTLPAGAPAFLREPQPDPRRHDRAAGRIAAHQHRPAHPRTGGRAARSACGSRTRRFSSITSRPGTRWPRTDCQSTRSPAADPWHPRPAGDFHFHARLHRTGRCRRPPMAPHQAWADHRKTAGGAGTVAVGTPVARRPPHRSVRAALPHTAPA